MNKISLMRTKINVQVSRREKITMEKVSRTEIKHAKNSRNKKQGHNKFHEQNQFHEEKN